MSEIVMITSGKGGVGKTTTTALMGLQLSQMDKKVVLIDTDFGLRNLDILFSLENKIIYNIVDVLHGTCTLKQALLAITNNLYLIPGTKNTDFRLTTDNLLPILSILDEQFDYILIDTPAGITDTHRCLLPCVSQSILVTTWDKASISDGIAMSRLLHCMDKPIRCILNEQHAKHLPAFWNKHPEEICFEFFDGDYIGTIPFQKEITMHRKQRTIKSIRQICTKI